VLADISAGSYVPHDLHTESRIWIEKNCYVDIWIEVLHSLRLDALAAMPFVLAIDFEGDQWTFFKPSHDDLRALYGIDVQELTVWRPLIAHAAEHLSAGKLISTEADAFWLPDTAGTDYRQQHSKTTIVLNDLDIERQRLGYFHNAGYHELQGEDFVKTFRLDVGHDPAFLPLFAELVRVDRVVRRAPDELAAMSRGLVAKYLACVPMTNPIRRFGERFARDLPQLQSAGMAHYHQWAFGTIRQLGAAFELASLHLVWLAEGGAPLTAAADFALIAQRCKALILKAARAVNSGRPLDASALFEDMANAWDRGMATLSNA
jgi:hypothetical protein